MFAHLLGRIAY